MNTAFLFQDNYGASEAATMLSKLKVQRKLTISEFKSLLEFAHYLLQSRIDDPSSYNLALSIICHSCEYCPEDEFIKQLIHDCVIASRVFLYDDMLERRNEQYNTEISQSIFSSFAKAFYTLDTETVLTREQKSLFDQFQEKRRIVVSAPTSFGKSRIVQEIIAHNAFKNIAIVLPTIALLNETFLKFKQNPLFKSYKLVNSINANGLEERNIFILTPEKMDLLLDQNPGIKIDFFTMDEIYKIQDDPDRKAIFTHCLYRLTKFECDFYLIGPYFNGFSPDFLEKNEAFFIKYTGEIVQKDVFDIEQYIDGDTYEINGSKLKKLKGKDGNLLKVISKLKEQTLIYVGRRDSVETRSRMIAGKIEETRSNDLIDYIKENIAEDWSLVECLKKGVGIHHSAIPKYIQSEIVDAFNAGDIRIIVCTSTLTEGVNTSAKNVVIYDNHKGGTPLTGFDVKNIKGRAGRFNIHFLGNIISLVNLVSDEDKATIEFSYYDKVELESEAVVQVDKSELNGQNLELREHIERTLKHENIPMELIRGNKFISIHRQVLLVKYLRNNPEVMATISFSGQMPTKENLDPIITLCHEYLFNEGDRDNKNFTISELARQTKFYIYKIPRIKALIANQNGAKIDTRIRRAFSLITHWFEFALPKYLTAFQNIFNFVASETKTDKINLTYLITKLEFGFSNSHEIAFKEAGVPNDIIHKIEVNFRDCRTIEEIRKKLQFNPFLLNKLTDFEKKIFFKYI